MAREGEGNFFYVINRGENACLSRRARVSHLAHYISDLVAAHKVLQVDRDPAQREVEIEPLQVHTAGITQHGADVSAYALRDRLELAGAEQRKRVAQYTGNVVKARRLNLG